MSTDIKSSEWNALVSGKEMVAADFWAPWCPYCRMLKPVFESIAVDYPQIRFVKVNVDEAPEVALKHGVQGIPVIKFFCEGKEIGEIVGYIPKENLKREIERISTNAASCLANTSLRR